MKLSTAIRLIEKGIPKNERQIWADFGAGTGLFTEALAKCLAYGSTIYAIDKDTSALSKLETGSLPATVKKISDDFLSPSLNLEMLDGILVANAIHYVDDKPTFINQLKKKIKSTGRIVVLEYEMTKANPWVPYPITIDNLEKLADDAELKLSKLDEEPSAFGTNTFIYSALLERINSK
jgi:ubiquinone/menaquinone biosynthesis C-methylase UbiE